ncbi:MAG: hypothetical protein V5A28_15245, partial [Haloarculaceae archaeon]
PVLGILLNSLLTVVLVVYLVRTDPLALGLSVGWIALGVVAYFGLVRSEAGGADETAVDAGAQTGETIVEGEDD